MLESKINEPEVLELLDTEQTEPYEDLFDCLGDILPEVPIIINERERTNLPAVLENEEEREEMIGKFELLVKILENSVTVEDVIANVDTAYREVDAVYEENIMVIFEQTKPVEKTIRALNLLYQNAHGEADVFILPVNKEKFADSANPKHFNIMQNHLRKQFFAWEIENSPYYITYIGDIGSKSAIDLMAGVALETRALAILDTKDHISAKAAMNHAKRLKIKGIHAKYAHMVIPCSYINALKAKDVQFVPDGDGKLRRIERKMAVPTAPAMIGKLLNVRAGVNISGLKADPIVGIDGVRMDYDLERVDAKELEKVGLVQVIAKGNIMGAGTANSSGNPDLRKFPKVDVANAILKDVVQFCNACSYSNWGANNAAELKKALEVYLNARQKQGYISSYEKIDDKKDIFYDKDTESVSINLKVHFFEVADEFDINLQGTENAVNLKNDKEK